ncbi:MAG: Xaa-Pro peptidase family protein [bacterium]|nr:Xaa-Pro peptidase family protein [bacterium]
MKLPFDNEKLDALMDKAGVDVILPTSKENIQYLLGGYKFFFFAHKDAIGVSRYLPMLGYPKGAPDKAFYIGNAMEGWQYENTPGFWVPNVEINQWFTDQTGKKAASLLRGIGQDTGTIAVEKAFLPADAMAAMEEELPGAKFVEAQAILHELRAVKRPEELAILKEASDTIIDCMTTVMKSTRAGATTREIAQGMYKEEVWRGLNFEYCLTAAGPSYNRAPSDLHKWEKGQVLSLDSGGNKDGYLGDLARMAVLGEPTQMQSDLLGEIRAIQDAARTAVRAGATGREIFEKALAEQAKCAHGDRAAFLAHGMGMIQHEAPHLTSSGAVPYPASYENRPLKAGMVLSIETDLKHPDVGFVKLEDTVIVTEDGWEAYGDEIRDYVIVEG